MYAFLIGTTTIFVCYGIPKTPRRVDVIPKDRIWLAIAPPKRTADSLQSIISFFRLQIFCATRPICMVSNYSLSLESADLSGLIFGAHDGPSGIEFYNRPGHFLSLSIIQLTSFVVHLNGKGKIVLSLVLNCQLIRWVTYPRKCLPFFYITRKVN